jgi:hypothetical protein
VVDRTKVQLAPSALLIHFPPFHIPLPGSAGNAGEFATDFC